MPKKLHTVATKQEKIKEHSAISAVRQGIYGNEPSPLNKARPKQRRSGMPPPPLYIRLRRKLTQNEWGKKRQSAKRQSAQRKRRRPWRMRLGGTNGQPKLRPKQMKRSRRREMRTT